MLWKLDRWRDQLLDGLTSKLHSSFLSLAELTLNSVLAKDLWLCYSEGISCCAPLENVEGFLAIGSRAEIGSCPGNPGLWYCQFRL